MTDLPAMYLWTDAYLGDTGHLSTFEHGAYLLILMAMWRKGGCLPDDDHMLAKIAKTTVDRWQRIAPTIRAFLTSENGYVTQKRLRAEITAAREKRFRLQSSGKAGGIAKSLKTNGHALAGPHVRSSIQSHNQNHIEIQDAIASSSSAEADDADQPNLFGEQKSKKIVRAERDEDLLDKITDHWNPWAATHNGRQVKALTGKRATRCRLAIDELMKLEGLNDPVEAFQRLLARCSESFFAKGEARKQLNFDQLMRADFMPRMLCGEFVYEPRPKPNGKWH